jgi:LacI family transcriptional regulator
MPTIKDVARLAGVSTATVSHVINGTRYVSQELHNRVTEAMVRLRYRPNRLAQSLRSGETKSIGLIVPDNSNPFFGEVARICEDVGFQNGYNVFLCNSDESLEKEAAYINMLIAKQIDGVILLSSGSDSSALRELARLNIPVVVTDRDSPDLDCDRVVVNNQRGGYQATRHLIDLGHRRIACIGGPKKLVTSQQRLKGYRRALKEAGIAANPEYVVYGDFRFQSGEEALQQLLQVEPQPTAVFACNDLMAIGALRALHRAGLRAPEQLSLVGFDDIPFSSVVVPALTSVAQPVKELAQTSMKLLLDHIKNSDQKRKVRRIILDPYLVERDSCAPLGVK